MTWGKPTILIEILTCIFHSLLPSDAVGTRYFEKLVFAMDDSPTSMSIECRTDFLRDDRLLESGVGENMLTALGADSTVTGPALVSIRCFLLGEDGVTSSSSSSLTTISGRQVDFRADRSTARRASPRFLLCCWLPLGVFSHDDANVALSWVPPKK